MNTATGQIMALCVSTPVGGSAGSRAKRVTGFTPTQTTLPTAQAGLQRAAAQAVCVH